MADKRGSYAGSELSWLRGMDAAVYAIADAMHKDNPKFDYEKFLEDAIPS